MKLGIARVLRESLAIAALLAVWALVALVTGHHLGGLRTAGTAFAVAYAIARGVAIADDAAPLPGTGTGDGTGPLETLPELVVESALTLAGVAVWFLAGALLAPLGPVVIQFVTLTQLEDLFRALQWFFPRVGLLTVVLIGVARGWAAMRIEFAADTGAGPDSATDASASGE